MVGIGMTEVTPDADAEFHHLFKLCLCGNSSVGKSVTLMRFTKDVFSPTHLVTIGVDFAVKTVLMRGRDLVKLQLWDTAGQEKYRSITSAYYKGVHGAVIFFDLTQRNTFEAIVNWIKQIKDVASERTAIMLAATKSDLKEERVVSREEIEAIAREHEVDFIEISAKTGDNVSKMFEMMLEKMIDAKENDQSHKTNSTTVKPTKPRSLKREYSMASMIESDTSSNIPESRRRSIDVVRISSNKPKSKTCAIL